MAGNIKGITIEFSGDTTKLDRSIKQVEKDTKAVDDELKQVNKSLKFNPTSVELWTQKQQLLKTRISETQTKLESLKQKQKSLDAKQVDKNSAEYRKLKREIVETESKLKHFKSELIKLGNAKLTALGNQFKQIGSKITGVGKKLTTSVTLPLAALGAVAVNKFAEVDKTMQLTNSTMGNTAEEAELLNEAMKEAAAASTYGMADAATATLNFARAGLSAEEAAAALAPAMALAAGEGGELDTVSGGLVATINGFHGSFDEASHYADVFANACNNSALDVNSLSEAMSIAAPIFAAAGYSVDDAALYMGVMANNGIEANKAANSLKTGLARLVSPSKQGAEMMDELGISVTNADGSMKDSVTIQKELHDAFGKLSESEQIAAASAIFGKNQMAPWLALINTAPGDVDKLNNSLQETGTAEKMQSDMMSGFGGSIEKLKSGIDVLMTSLGEALAPTIQKVVDWLQKLTDWFNALDPETQTLIATIGTIAAVLGPVLVVVGTIVSAIGTVITAIGSVISFIGSAISVIGTVGPAVLAALSGPIGWIIAAIAAVIAIGVLLYKNWDKIKAVAAEVGKAVVQAWNDMVNKVKTQINILKAVITIVWNAIKTKVLSVVNSLKNTVVNVFNSLKARVTSIFNAIKNAITRPIQTAVNLVRAAINKIKAILSTKLSLPKIKLPHFKISGSFSLNPPSVPSIGVDWYKQGGIFTRPTVAGLGEAGPEGIIPLDKLWQKLDAIAAATSDNVANAIGTGLAIQATGASMPGTINVVVELDGAKVGEKVVHLYDYTKRAMG
ncbi:MAG: phage tail tape measure protein [Mogibacterium sp.]|nr:phage tail tape measure protein [Mogibacterium sp.]